MIVSVPKEIKNNESRVALSPADVLEMKKAGHQVKVQSTAGIGSGFTDQMYQEAGADILPDLASTYAAGEMIMKVKEPIEEEWSHIKEGHTLFTYFHFASSLPLTQAMQKQGAVCIAYETVESASRTLPLLIPMSEVAGRMATQQGAKYLEAPMGGRGILMGGVPGVRPAKVMILGGGIVGTQAAWMAAGLGADVTILDNSLARLRYLDDVMPKNVNTLMSNEHNIRELLPTHDLIIGAVLIPGAKAPHLVTKDMLKTMRPGTVVIDVAVDQGGCIETTHPTTHENPTYFVEDVLHYGVANMPGAVPYTSTLALTHATLPYALQIANKGWKQACKDNRELLLGLNMVGGKVTYEAVAQAAGLDFTPAEEVL